MSIKEELDKSIDYMLETTELDGETIVKLTRENVAKVEAMIRNDSAYYKAFDKDAKPIKFPRKKPEEYKYGGSTAYWVKQLKEILIEGKQKSTDDHSFEKIVTHLVSAIDRENSTHLNADGNGRKVICKRIKDNRENLCKWLKNEDRKYEIINCLSQKTDDDKGRENLSFASKFAHYAAFYLFEGTEFQDGFSIYDGILVRVLPKYMKAYNIQIKGYKKNYQNYQKAIDSIIDAAEKENEERISRNGFDHLVWYYHKARE